MLVTTEANNSGLKYFRFNKNFIIYPNLKFMCLKIKNKLLFLNRDFMRKCCFKCLNADLEEKKKNEILLCRKFNINRWK